MSIHTLNRNNYRSNIKVKTYNNTYTNSFCQSKLTADKFQYKTKISFNKSEGPSQETLDYINKERKKLEENGEKLSSLYQLKLSKIEDIAAGIDVFEGWSSYDLAFIGTNFDVICLQRGCAHQCSHCGANAEKKITTMDWENFLALANAMGELKNRLGFNIFKEQESNAIFPFSDSDPMFYKAPIKITAQSGESQTSYKNIYDALNLLYEKTGSKSVITTAGWDPNNHVSQNAALSFASDHKALKKVSLSISPFHHHMEMAKLYEQKATTEIDPEKKELLHKKAQSMQDKYINMIADNLVTIWPITDNTSLNIILLYDKNKTGFYSSDNAINILIAIQNKVKERLKEKFNQSKFDSMIKYRAIEYIGRAINLRDADLNNNNQEQNNNFFMNTIRNKYKNYKKIIKRPLRIDVDGSILINLISNTYAKADVRSYLVKLTDKKLKFPNQQLIKTDKTLPEISWPSTEFLKKYTGTYFSFKYILKYLF